MVLFVFVVMMLNLGEARSGYRAQWLDSWHVDGPGILARFLIAEIVYLLLHDCQHARPGAASVDPKQVGMALFGPYLIGVELASMLLLARAGRGLSLAGQTVRVTDGGSIDGTHTDGTRVAAGGNLVRAGTDRHSGDGVTDLHPDVD